MSRERQNSLRKRSLRKRSLRQLHHSPTFRRFKKNQARRYTFTYGFSGNNLELDEQPWDVREAKELADAALVKKGILKFSYIPQNRVMLVQGTKILTDDNARLSDPSTPIDVVLSPAAVEKQYLLDNLYREQIQRSIPQRLRTPENIHNRSIIRSRLAEFNRPLLED